MNINRFCVWSWMVVSAISSCLALQKPLIGHPVIGVLSQEIDSGDTKESFIDSTYVQFMQQSGALVVPIRINNSPAYYEDLFKKLNGVVFPGGGVSIIDSGYAKAAQIFYKLAVKAKDGGDHFPMLGICLGFQLLSALTAGEDVLCECHGQDMSLPLSFTAEMPESRLFRDMPKPLMYGLSRWNLTYNNHQYCLTTKNVSMNHKLNKFYRVSSLSKDELATSFISTMEAYKYPFYGTQWHPSKTIYSWAEGAHVNHSVEAVAVAQHVSNFFIAEARKSSHHFRDVRSLSTVVINNYQPVFKGPPSFHELYMFSLTAPPAADMWGGIDFSFIRGQYRSPPLQADAVLFICIMCVWGYILFTILLGSRWPVEPGERRGGPKLAEPFGTKHKFGPVINI